MKVAKIFIITGGGMGRARGIQARIARHGVVSSERPRAGVRLG